MQAVPVKAEAGGTVIEVSAHCDITGQREKNMEFEVVWVIDGIDVKTVPLKPSETSITLKEFEHGFKAGTTVSCNLDLLSGMVLGGNLLPCLFACLKNIKIKFIYLFILKLCKSNTS